jgi:hypothetical protein
LIKQAGTGKLQDGGIAAAIVLMIRPAGEIIGRPFSSLGKKYLPGRGGGKWHRRGFIS